jgi:hypothetical protein
MCVRLQLLHAPHAHLHQPIKPHHPSPFPQAGTNGHANSRGRSASTASPQIPTPAAASRSPTCKQCMGHEGSSNTPDVQMLTHCQASTHHLSRSQQGCCSSQTKAMYHSMLHAGTCSAPSSIQHLVLTSEGYACFVSVLLVCSPQPCTLRDTHLHWLVLPWTAAILAKLQQQWALQPQQAAL